MLDSGMGQQNVRNIFHYRVLYLIHTSVPTGRLFANTIGRTAMNLAPPFKEANNHFAGFRKENTSWFVKLIPRLKISKEAGQRIEINAKSFKTLDSLCFLRSLRDGVF
jgi:hypothetical protein